MTWHDKIWHIMTCHVISWHITTFKDIWWQIIMTWFYVIYMTWLLAECTSSSWPLFSFIKMTSLFHSFSVSIGHLCPRYRFQHLKFWSLDLNVIQNTVYMCIIEECLNNVFLRLCLNGSRPKMDILLTGWPYGLTFPPHLTVSFSWFFGVWF